MGSEMCIRDSLIGVAGHREDDGPRTSSRETPHDSAEQEDLEGRCERADHRTKNHCRQCNEHDGAPAVTIGEGTPHERAEPECGEKQGDGQRHRQVGVGQAIVGFDLVECGQDGIDADGDRRRNERRQRNVLAPRQPMPGPLLGLGDDRRTLPALGQQLFAQ